MDTIVREYAALSKGKEKWRQNLAESEVWEWADGRFRRLEG